jgi:ribosome maturation factor RimP
LSGQTPTLFFPSRKFFLKKIGENLIARVSALNDKDARKGLEIEVLVRSVAERVAASSGLDLVDIELKRGGKGPLLRIFMDKPERISLDELENVSREMSAILDVEDPIGRSYTLEVSSPGMTRPLKTPRDFGRVLQKNVQVAFVAPPGADAATEPLAKESIKEIKGRLLAVTDAEVRIVPRDNKGREGAEVIVPFSALRHAQREISFR